MYIILESLFLFCGWIDEIREYFSRKFLMRFRIMFLLFGSRIVILEKRWYNLDDCKLEWGKTELEWTRE